MRKVFLFSALVGLGLTAHAQTPLTMDVELESSKVYLIDGPQISCVSAHSPSPTADLTNLTADLGRLTLKWIPPTPNSTLKLVYVSVRFDSTGLDGSTTANPIIVAGQELNCVAMNDPFVSPVIHASNATFTSAFEMRIGGLIPMDRTKIGSFSGKGKVVVYGLVRTPGMQDESMVGRTEFDFNFGTIY